MRRRSFLLAAGAAAVSPWTASPQSSLGTLVWIQPDGMYIRTLPDGRPSKLLSGGNLHHPRFSRDGTLISYQTGDDDSFSAITIDGRPATTVTSPDRLPSPDGKQLAIVEIHERPNDEYGLNRDKTELYIAPANKPEERSQVLIDENEGGIQLYGWTRDGKSLVYWRAGEWSGSLWSDGVDLYSIPVAGGPERKLGIQALAHHDLLDLAPKRNLLAVTRGSGRETWTDQRIAIADLDSGAIRNLTASDVSALSPSWSPDGSTIAYTAAPDAANLGGGERAHRNLHQRKIWTIDASGASAPRQIANDPHYRDEEPLWSADGSHILFGRMDYNGNPSLWLMKSDGSEARHLCPLELNDDLGAGEHWFGYYGYIDWRSAFHWRR